jgi:hypothetical protein
MSTKLPDALRVKCPVCHGEVIATFDGAFYQYAAHGYRRKTDPPPRRGDYPREYTCPESRLTVPSIVLRPALRAHQLKVEARKLAELADASERRLP